MFGLVRGLMRHKVGTLAVIGTAAFFFSTGDDEQPQSNNPWAVQAGPAQSSGEASYVDQAVDAGMEYLDEAGINPVTHGEETVQRLDNSAAAMGAANREN